MQNGQSKCIYITKWLKVALDKDAEEQGKTVNYLINCILEDHYKNSSHKTYALTKAKDELAPTLLSCKLEGTGKLMPYDVHIAVFRTKDDKRVMIPAAIINDRNKVGSLIMAETGTSYAMPTKLMWESYVFSVTKDIIPQIYEAKPEIENFLIEMKNAHKTRLDRGYIVCSGSLAKYWREKCGQPYLSKLLLSTYVEKPLGIKEEMDFTYYPIARYGKIYLAASQTAPKTQNQEGSGLVR